MSIWIGLVFISGCESPKYLNKQIPDFTLNDTLITLEAKSDFSYYFSEKFSFKVQQLADLKLRLIFENHCHSDIWLCENNAQEETDSTLQLMYSPDLSLLSPLYFRRIKPGKSLAYDLNFDPKMKQFDLGVMFLSDLEQLTANLNPIQHSTKKRDLLTVPMAGISEEGTFLLYAKNIPLDNSAQVIELRIMH